MNDVALRDVTDGDLPIFFEQQREPDANRMAAFPARDEAAFVAHWARILHDEANIIKTILFGGQVAGNIVSFEQSGRRQVGYWLGKAYWGRGIATQALSMFLRVVEARPLYAYVARHNMASVRVLEKCGFTLCGEDERIADARSEEGDEVVLKLDAKGRDGAP